MAEIGRRRGVSREAIRKRVGRWVAAGALTTKPGPRGAVLVNIVMFDRLAADDTDPSHQLRKTGKFAGLAEVDDRPIDAEVETGSGAGTYANARADRESYQAENARLDLEERLGRLVDHEEVGRLQMDLFRRHRDRLLSVPARIQDRLAAAPDGPAMRQILTEELRRELESFADHLESLPNLTTKIPDDDQVDAGDNDDG